MDSDALLQLTAPVRNSFVGNRGIAKSTTLH